MQRLTSEQHYRVAEKLLADEDVSWRVCNGGPQDLLSKVRASDARIREVALVHAALASAGITQADVERMDAEDEAEMDRLRVHAD